MTSSLSHDSYSLKVGSFSFGSLVSASSVSDPMFEINTTEDNKNITTPMLSGSGKTPYPLFLCLQVPRQKSVVLGLLLITAQADQ